MTQVITIVNAKGGTGKTTTAVNLSAFLAEKGKKVLLVDMDSQANATFCLGINPKILPLSIYNVLVGQVTPYAVLQKRATLPAYDLFPASPDLAAVTVELVNMEDREFKLRQILEDIKKDYDFVIIDCPPSLGLLTINALCAADKLLIPVQCEYLSLEGLEQLLKTIELVKNNLEKNLEIAGVLLTMYDRRSHLSREVAKEIRRKFSGKIFEAVIPRSAALAEAPKFGRTIIEHAPNSKAYFAYRELAEEIINFQLPEQKEKEKSKREDIPGY
jgi:chromosome partitioning protein